MIKVLDIYNKFSKWPFGSFLFSKAVGFTAPFFSKIKPRVLMLKPAYCSVAMKERRGLRNHIGSVNAGALCTLAELTGGMALDATISNDLRWIPKSMTVKYQKKAKGNLIAVCDFAADSIVEGDVVLPVLVHNQAQEQVFEAEITFYISQRKI